MKPRLDLPIICPVLIGRTTDLATLFQLINRAKSGKGGFALLSGEAGIGKSRLVAELKTEAVAQGFQSLQGHCFPTDRACPYAPLLDVLRSVFLHTPAAQLAMSVGPFARELSPLLPEVPLLFPELASLPLLPSLDPEQEKRRLFAALARFFLTQAATHPLLLSVEDVHWSDETSLEFLQYLGWHCASQPLLVLLTYRSDEIGPGLSQWLAHVDRERLAHEIVLTRLTCSDTDAMLRAIFNLQRPVQAEALGAIYTLTEGNPFFIEEILKSLVATGEIVYTDGSWERKPLGELHIPHSIQDAVQRRVDKLSKSARQLVILAAVAGRRFDFDVLQQVTHHDEQQLLPLIKELMAAQLVVEESAEHFAFRHALTRQAIYAQLLARERKVLHRSIAEMMEQFYAGALEAHLADLASHFSEAGLWGKALSYAQQAGERAQRLYAPRAAIEQYTLALDAARHLALAPLPTLYHARGKAYEILGNFEQARHDYEQAEDAARNVHDRIAEWQSVLDLGFLWSGRDYRQTGVYYHRAMELARAMASPQLLAHSLNRLGNWHSNVELPFEALHSHQEALAVFQEVQDQHGVAETLDLLASAIWLKGELVQSAAYYRQVVELFCEMDNREGLVNSLTTLLTCGDSYDTVMVVPAAISVTELQQEGER
jgi:predicted ATPase